MLLGIFSRRSIFLKVYRQNNVSHAVRYFSLHFSRKFLFQNQLASCNDESILKAMRKVINPHACCEKVYELIKSLVVQINEKCDDPRNNPNKADLYHEETLSLMKHRWEKIEKDFHSNEGFDISLVPDIYDCVKYDYLHNT